MVQIVSGPLTQEEVAVARLIGDALAAADRYLQPGGQDGPGVVHDTLMRVAREVLAPGILSMPHRLEDVTSQFFTEAIDQASSAAMTDYGLAGMLYQDDAERGHFEQRLSQRWADGLTQLAAMRLLSLHAGVTHHARLAPAEGDWKYGVLVRLHARACLISGEVLALLRAGFASGAHARWRSLHEVAVVALFIRERDNDMARRYLRHGAIESLRAADMHVRHAARLQEPAPTEDEVHELRLECDKLIAEYGPSYKGQYGWAACEIGHSPTFAEIEERVSLDHLRPYYKLASHPTHAGPKGLTFDIGVGVDPVMLAGPSNAGLADPGHGTAISLLQVTTAYLCHRPDSGDAVNLQILVRLCDAVGDAFIAAHRNLEAEDRDHRWGIDH